MENSFQMTFDGDVKGALETALEMAQMNGPNLTITFFVADDPDQGEGGPGTLIYVNADSELWQLYHEWVLARWSGAREIGPTSSIRLPDNLPTFGELADDIKRKSQEHAAMRRLVMDRQNQRQSYIAGLPPMTFADEAAWQLWRNQAASDPYLTRLLNHVELWAREMQHTMLTRHRPMAAVLGTLAEVEEDYRQLEPDWPFDRDFALMVLATCWEHGWMLAQLDWRELPNP